MSCRLIIVRHGQSLGNLEHTFLGHTDKDLSPLGYKQAERTAEYLKNEQIDCIYSSDLLRAHNTGKAYSDISGLPITDDEGLREIYAGKWENSTFDDLITKYPVSYGQIWLNNIGFAKPDGGESVADLTDRAFNTIKKIADENEGKTVAIFTHATVLRSFFNKIYGFGLDKMKDIKWASNTSVSEAVYENGVFKPIRYSFDDFMSDIKTDVPVNC